jgi:hypothetical protein
MAHACNPNYSGSRDQEDQGLKSAQADGSQGPSSKKKKTNPNTKTGLAEWLNW